MTVHRRQFLGHLLTRATEAFLIGVLVGAFLVWGLSMMMGWLQ